MFIFRFVFFHIDGESDESDSSEDSSDGSDSRFDVFYGK